MSSEIVGETYFDTQETDARFKTTKWTTQMAEAMRSSSEYKTGRDVFRQKCARENLCCWLCGSDIDYSLPFPHPFCWSLDHKKTVKEAPELFMDRNNWAPAHLDCNKRRGTDEPPMDIGVPSEVW